MRVDLFKFNPLRRVYAACTNDSTYLGFGFLDDRTGLDACTGSASRVVDGSTFVVDGSTGF